MWETWHVRTVFQRLVDLDTGATVGYEALTRGPAGGPLEAPAALFDAAYRAGRVAELDWLARGNALRTALEANLSPDLSWFVNTEPASMGAVCPPELRPVGQGWLFGRPGPLPAAAGPVVPLSACTGPARPFATTGTPFSTVAPHRPVNRTRKDLLLPMSLHLEHTGLDPDDPIVLLGCFQHAAHFTAATRRRYTGLATSAAFVGALGARDCGDTGPDAGRRFDYAVTHDRDLVIAAATTLLPLLLPRYP